MPLSFGAVLDEIADVCIEHRVGKVFTDQSTRLRRVSTFNAEEPIKFERGALRWLARYVAEGKAVSLMKAQLALLALAELRSGEREAAAKLLMAWFGGSS